MAIGSPAVRPPGAGRYPPVAAFRTDLEGLRAVAIIAVLGFHASVPGAAGGFVGVDVFFVLSGFLVTGQLLGPLHRTGRVALRDFYARRARRILPAAGFTLLAVTAASWFLLPPLRRQDVDRDVLAAALYVPNWRFIGKQVNYSAAGLDVSPLLHY
ncbi:MAG: acyltransferase [Actinobacteria bacterium]|nr:acyltransferase [Actinomycetota bacterium]MBI3688434.1 acyltransferase [Actinomycetota bacterium]